MTDRDALGAVRTQRLDRYARAGPLSTVRQAVARKGEIAVASLLAVIRGGPSATDTLLPTELVVRESTSAFP